MNSGTFHAQGVWGFVIGIMVTVTLTTRCVHLQLLQPRRQTVAGRDGALARLRVRARDGGVQMAPHLRPDGPASGAWAAAAGRAAAA